MKFLRYLIVLISLAMLSTCGEDKGTSPPSPSETSIGAEGGTATSLDSKATVVLPAAAVSSEVDITIAEAAGCPAGSVGKAYTFGPEGVQFEQPVQLSIQYDPKEIPAGEEESGLRVGKVVANGWQRVPGSSVDTTTHAVTASVQSFSTYGVVGQDGAGADPAVFHALNEQVCHIVDAVREVNLGQILMMKGATKDFTMPLVDAPSAFWTEQELNLQSAGLSQLAQGVESLGSALDAFDALASGLQRTARPVRTSEDPNNGLTMAQYKAYLEQKIAKYSQDYMEEKFDTGLNKAAEETTELLKEIIHDYFEHCINKNLRLNLEAIEDQLKNALCVPAYARNYKWRWAYLQHNRSTALATVNSMLGGLTFQQTVDLDAELASPVGVILAAGAAEYRKYSRKDRRFEAIAAAKFCEAGGVLYLDTVMGVVTPAYDTVKGLAGGAVDVLMDASTWLFGPPQKPGVSLTGKEEADAVILLFPDDTENVPIQVAAVKAQNGVMTIPEVCTDSYTAFLYSKGNYPVILEDLEVSIANHAVEVPTPFPLPGMAPPSSFPAQTVGDVSEQLDPPAPPPTPVEWEDIYRVTHEYKLSVEGRAPNGPWDRTEVSTSAEFQVTFTQESVETPSRDTVSVKVPYTVNRTHEGIPNAENPDVGMWVFEPSTFSLDGELRWNIRREVRDGELCFKFSASTGEENTQTVQTSVLAEGVEAVWGEATHATFSGGVGYLPSWDPPGGDWRCGDFPLVWERNESAPDTPSEYRVLVRIEYLSSE